jgi:hypothetical protein
MANSQEEIWKGLGCTLNPSHKKRKKCCSSHFCLGCPRQSNDNCQQQHTALGKRGRRKAGAEQSQILSAGDLPVAEAQDESSALIPTTRPSRSSSNIVNYAELPTVRKVDLPLFWKAWGYLSQRRCRGPSKNEKLLSLLTLLKKGLNVSVFVRSSMC